MTIIRVLLADDHQIVRDGLKALMEDEKDIEIVAEAENGNEVLRLVKEQPVDIVVMDINMPDMDGIECTRKLQEYDEAIRILALTMMGEEQHIRSMIKAGAAGYIMKESGQDELVNAIRDVVAGHHYFSDDATQTIMMDLIREDAAGGEQPEAGQGGTIPLTRREIEILRYIAYEYTNQEISEKLYISIRTVDAHRRNLLQKIGARNTAGLVRYAVDHGLLDERG